MKNFPLLFFLVLSTACTSRVMVLQTDEPNVAKYWLIFGKKLVDYSDNAPAFEKQLNEILRSDPNTKNCLLESGSINFGEPGSQGSAIVLCRDTINVALQDGIYNQYNKPFYYYELQLE